jgi:hypothetical protein
MTFYHYHDKLTEEDIKGIGVYRLTIVYYVNSKEHGNTHIHYLEAANGALLVVLMTALIVDIFDIERIEITRA